MGLALFWKKAGVGSQETLGQFKESLGLGKSRYGIGHTGTLDPFAEGILCVGISEGTKILAPLVGLQKNYIVRMALGAASSSFDLTGTITWPEKLMNSIALKEKLEAKIQGYLASKIGEFSQIPPQLSAVHVDGKRAYEWARAGVQKELKSRPAQILSAKHHSLEIESFEGKDLLIWNFEVEVSSGTYIRALARDWGLELCGIEGFLTRLIRNRIGPFSMTEAEGLRWVGLEELKSLFDTESLTEGMALEIVKFGRWKLQSSTKNKLLLDPLDVPVAWVEAPSGRLGRVFLNNPLSAP